MKKIIRKIIDVVNIIANLFFGVMAVANGVSYATNGYVYSDELVRVFAFLIMVILMNGIHFWIRKQINEF